MAAPHIHPSLPPFSASSATEATGYALTSIKHRDGLTDDAIGELLVKSGDRAAEYRKGEAPIDLVTFLRGVRAWGARFANPILSTTGHRLCATTAARHADRAAPRVVNAAALKLAAAVESDDDIDEDELRDAADAILDAGALFDNLRDRLARLGIGGEQ